MKLKYGINDDDFIYDEIEEVIEALRDEYDTDQEIIGHEYYSIECRPVLASDLVSVWAITDSIEEQMGYIVGESFYDDDPIVDNKNKEAMDELKTLLEQWIIKYGKFEGYWKCLGKLLTHTITKDDLA